MITNKNYNVDLAKLSNKKLYKLLKELYFDEEALGNKSTEVKSLIRLLKSPDILAASVRESNTRWLSADPNELCDRLNLLLQKKQAGKNFNIIIEEIVAIADKVLECKCMSTKSKNFCYYLYIK